MFASVRQNLKASRKFANSSVRPFAVNVQIFKIAYGRISVRITSYHLSADPRSLVTVAPRDDPGDDSYDPTRVTNEHAENAPACRSGSTIPLTATTAATFCRAALGRDDSRHAPPSAIHERLRRYPGPRVRYNDRPLSADAPVPHATRKRRQPMALTRDQVIAALRTVQDPELFKDIVTLGMVKDVQVARRQRQSPRRDDHAPPGRCGSRWRPMSAPSSAGPGRRSSSWS